MTSASADCFLDTNVLLYAATGKRSEPRKFRIAFELVTHRTFGVSAQTLAEFYAASQKRELGPLPAEEADHWIELLALYPHTDLDADLVRRGIGLSRVYGIQYYDAALLAAAERLGAPIFFSEDLNHHQVYGSVMAVNPFLEG
jgi:predicted nucleic acid-binding protein